MLVHVARVNKMFKKPKIAPSKNSQSSNYLNFTKHLEWFEYIVTFYLIQTNLSIHDFLSYLILFTVVLVSS